jgi:hypothetical protein
MKLHETRLTICALLLIAWMGCGGEDLESQPAISGPALKASENGPLSREATRLIQARADAAFAALGSLDDTDGRKTRFESRIGLQPWPRDLPESWPKPLGASVVADTTGRNKGRLLLIDLSDSIEIALDSYRGVLRDSGFEVVRAGAVGRGRALRASRGRTEASLRFFAREDATRLEILFIAH